MNNTVKPAAVLDFGLARDGVDVNVTPDKRQVGKCYVSLCRPTIKCLGRWLGS